MKIFEKDDKINFVDSNNVFVGFDYHSSCCEQFGYSLYRICNETAYVNCFIEDKQIRELFSDVTRIDPEKEDLSEYVFDTSFYRPYNSADKYDEGGSAVFRLSKNNQPPDLYLEIFNSHNGYYSHGFDFCHGDTVIVSGSL